MKLSPRQVELLRLFGEGRRLEAHSLVSGRPFMWTLTEKHPHLGLREVFPRANTVYGLIKRGLVKQVRRRQDAAWYNMHDYVISDKGKEELKRYA